MRFVIKCLFDEEAGVWVATSDDIIGLVLEDESLDRLMERVDLAIPELLELNGVSEKPKIVSFSAEREMVPAYG